MLTFAGRARKLGDSINTDYIISSSRKRETIDPDVLKQWLLESVDPDFAASVQPDDVLVAGERFGSGSAMEVAVTVVLAAGIRVVLAKSFSRTYYRNALNNGLVPIEIDSTSIAEHARLRIEIDALGIRVDDDTAQLRIDAPPFSPFALKLLQAGGIVPLVARAGDLGSVS